MAMIPENIYQACERKLRQRGKLVSNAMEQLERARAGVRSSGGTSLSEEAAKMPGVDPSTIHGKGGRNSAEDAVMNELAAEENLTKAAKWEQVFCQLDEEFAGTLEEKIAVMILRKGIEQKDVAYKLRMDRQTIRRRYDKYITYCALLACENGLLSVWKGSGESEDLPILRE